MTRREMMTTMAYQVPEGAELCGGPYDGMVVVEALVGIPVNGIAPPGVRAYVRLVLVGGEHVDVDTSETVSWLQPTGGGTNG